jgi:hypothetical protein
MKLMIPVAFGMLGAGMCCCGDLVAKISELAGVEMPIAGVGGGGSVTGPLADIPAYAGAELVTSATMGTLSSGTWRLKDATDSDVIAFYKTSLTGSGWTVDAEVVAQGSSVLQCSKDGKTLSIALTDDPTTSGSKLLTLSIQG